MRRIKIDKNTFVQLERNLVKMRKKRLKLGDIYEISLPNEMNAYGRLYKESTLAIYEKICSNVDECKLQYIFV
ncbi:hypothetical protein TVTCOM_04420 [Terrisporobacter vanillatitrophus]